MESITRRSILGCLGITTISGCLSNSQEDEKIMVGNIRVGNGGDDPFRITLHFEDEDEVLYEEELEVASGEYRIIDEWSPKDSQHTLMYESEGTIRHFVLPHDVEDISSGCIDIEIRYLRGDVEIYFYDDTPSWSDCSN